MSWDMKRHWVSRKFAERFGNEKRFCISLFTFCGINEWEGVRHFLIYFYNIGRENEIYIMVTSAT